MKLIRFYLSIVLLSMLPLWVVADNTDCPDGYNFSEDLNTCIIKVDDHTDSNGNTAPSSTPIPSPTPANNNNDADNFDWNSEITPTDIDSYTQLINGNIEADDVIMTSLFNDIDAIVNCTTKCSTLPTTSTQTTLQALNQLTKKQLENFCRTHLAETRCQKLKQVEGLDECKEAPNSSDCLFLLNSVKSGGCLIDSFSEDCMAVTVSPSCIRNPSAANCFTHTDTRDDFDALLIDCDKYNNSLVCVEEEKVDCRYNRSDNFCLSTLPKKTALLSNKVGNVIYANTLNAQAHNANGAIRDISAMVTLEQSETTVEREQGISVNLKANTIAIFQPPNTQNSDLVSFLGGELNSSFDCTLSTSSSQKVVTPIADIDVTSCTGKKVATQTTNFTSQYSSTSGTDSSLTVSVQSGSVSVTDRSTNQVTTLTAGESVVISDSVPRVSWVTPIDNDYIYANKENTFVWTEFSNASGYMIEYNLPTPVFAENNTTKIEYSLQTITLSPADYQIFNNMVVYKIPLGQTPKGTQFEARIFPLDASGNILATSTSSDKITIWSK